MLRGLSLGTNAYVVRFRKNIGDIWSHARRKLRFPEQLFASQPWPLALSGHLIQKHKVRVWIRRRGTRGMRPGSNYTVSSHLVTPNLWTQVIRISRAICSFHLSLVMWDRRHGNRWTVVRLPHVHQSAKLRNELCSGCSYHMLTQSIITLTVIC